MEFFETSASNSNNIAEVGHMVHLLGMWCYFSTLFRSCGGTPLLLLHVLFFLFFLLPQVIHSCDRTGAAGTQEGRGQLVGILGWLSRKGCSGRGEPESRYRQCPEGLWLLAQRHLFPHSDLTQLTSAVFIGTLNCWKGACFAGFTFCKSVRFTWWWL